MDNELTLFDRINVIRDIIRKHGEEYRKIGYRLKKRNTNDAL